MLVKYLRYLVADMESLSEGDPLAGVGFDGEVRVGFEVDHLTDLLS